MGFYANFNALKRSSNSYKLHWPIPSFEVDELLSVISPLRVSSFYCSMTPGRGCYTVQIQRISFANNP